MTGLLSRNYWTIKEFSLQKIKLMKPAAYTAARKNTG